MTPHAYLPPALERGRTWGFALNLYALRSQRNWGVGDFTDLREAVRILRGFDAGVIGINPLHALHYLAPDAASPYSPTSRYFLNPLYIDVEAVEEFEAAGERADALRRRISSEVFRETLAGLRATRTVEYARVARAKWSAFEELYAIFSARKGERRRAFEAFVQRGGIRLERFALYEALNERFAGDAGRVRGWMTWPQEYRDPASPAVAAFAARYRRRVRYYQYLQWLADGQLAQAAAQAQGAAIGLYRDLAVGVDRGGADVWSEPDAYVLEESVGAPPDPFGPLGQNWGFPPADPERLLRDGGTSFRELLRANMIHAGALRIDHVMGLMRLYRIPSGKPASEGAYVSYPFEQLLGMLLSESVGARCVVVGEDLGTVPEGFRERMGRAAILSHPLLLFERDFDGRFRAPHEYPALALATATTHDLPTLGGWAIGRDIDVREELGLLRPADAVEARSLRRIDLSHLLEALRAHAALGEADFHSLHATVDAKVAQGECYEPLVRAAYRFLAETPSRVVLIQLDDALGELDQVNLPGTFVEYTNWRRKTSFDLEGIAADPRVAAIAGEVRERIRRGNQG